MLCYDIRKNIFNICTCISVINRYNSDAMQLIEHNITKYLTFFVHFSLVSMMFYITLPAILQFEAIVSDAVTNQTFEAPFHDMYDTFICHSFWHFHLNLCDHELSPARPFSRYYFVDTTRTPLFQIFYVVYCIPVLCIVAMYLAKNLLFVGMCMYIVALSDELKAQLRRIDGQNLSVARRLRQLKHCIRMHNRIIGWDNYDFSADEWTHIIRNIIFTAVHK